jgi:hypothetical protein
MHEHHHGSDQQQVGQLHQQSSVQHPAMSQAVNIKQPSQQTRAPLYAVAAPAPRQQHLHQQQQPHKASSKEGS